MGRGKFKGKPTGHRNFSTPEEIISGTSARPRTFKQIVSENMEEKAEGGSEDEVEEQPEKLKGTGGVIEVENPNLVKPKNGKTTTKHVTIGKTTELSRREREEIEKQKSHERYMKLQEQGKTEQAKKDLERLSLVRQQRAAAARKREEEKAAREKKKAEAQCS